MKNNWEERFDEKADDWCIAFIPDGYGDESNLYLSEAMNYSEIKAWITKLIASERADAAQKAREELWKQLKGELECQQPTGEYGKSVIDLLKAKLKKI